MNAIILAATHERALNSLGVEVPRPLLDLGDEPLLTILVRRLAKISGISNIYVVTNEAIKPALESWTKSLPTNFPIVDVVSDGTILREEAKGAIGDLIFAIVSQNIKSDVIVVGGDNWFTYDIRTFIEQSRNHSPAVLVTPVEAGWDVSRFGMVKLDKENRIIQFDEKPHSSTFNLKASCVYFFSASELKWLDTFAGEHSTICPPGVFFSWLVHQTTVYGVKMSGAWYDISPPVPLKGPEFLSLREILRKIVNLTDSTWKGVAGRQIQWTNSYKDILEVLEDDDPNRRIIATRLAGQATTLLTDEAKARLVSKLLDLLGDPARNEYQYAGFQCDESSISYVSFAAATSLAELGYASDINSVFEKARKEGHKVQKHRDVRGEL